MGSFLSRQWNASQPALTPRRDEIDQIPAAHAELEQPMGDEDCVPTIRLRDSSTILTPEGEATSTENFTADLPTEDVELHPRTAMQDSAKSETSIIGTAKEDGTSEQMPVSREQKISTDTQSLPDSGADGIPDEDVMIKIYDPWTHTDKWVKSKTCIWVKEKADVYTPTRWRDTVTGNFTWTRPPGGEEELPEEQGVVACCTGWAGVPAPTPEELARWQEELLLAATRSVPSDEDADL